MTGEEEAGAAAVTVIAVTGLSGDDDGDLLRRATEGEYSDRGAPRDGCCKDS